LTGQSVNDHEPIAERVGIVGSGAIACGLATVVAGHDRVVLWARSDGSAERAQRTVTRLCEKLGAPVNGNVHVTCDPSAIAGATFVVEAIAEDLEVKAAVLGEMGGRLPPDAILATTTSSLSIAELARASGRPDRFVGLHVFNPVPKMELVELAFPRAATETTRARARALCAVLGKTAVEVPDTAGFVVNRLLFPYLFDAVRLMERTGLEPDAIDACMRMGAGHPIGPLALLDLVGLDVAAAIGRTIGVEVPARIEAMIASGALGRKAGAGFYEYGAQN
jgi:3-hydroxybutyryl-CoA dehydrogenase